MIADKSVAKLQKSYIGCVNVAQHLFTPDEMMYTDDVTIANPRRARGGKSDITLGTERPSRVKPLDWIAEMRHRATLAEGLEYWTRGA